MQIASRPGIHNMRCLFRVAFVPRDACDLAQQDLTAFEYLYLQVDFFFFVHFANMLIKYDSNQWKTYL